ncbi:MAG: DNA-directed RNA polymerase subunit omega [Salinivirgaceae bacterium]|jgi:DNA-directed RNA polymerase subunit K/omega|nr:DNA-directed RNA polymerase subunit omega [Salinivirgaceae bacterium]
MDFKKVDAPLSTETRDMSDIADKTGNVYESINIISKRANQINAELKDELTRKLEEFASVTDNLEEIFENREQIEISKFYERLPKPALIATEEFLNDKIVYKYPDEKIQ